MAEEAPKRRVRWWLPALLGLVTVGVLVALLTGESGGTRASAPAPTATPAPAEPPESAEPEARSTARPRRTPTPTPADCEATESNPGGTNNYLPDAPRAESLGEGFRVRGTVRETEGCRPVAGVRIQVWLADDSGGETENRASVRTDARGRWAVETGQPAPQFGEPNVHVGYADGRYREVFLRRVVDREGPGETIDLVLRRAG